MLSTKKGKEAYVEPVIEGRDYRFTVKVGRPPDAERSEARARSVEHGGQLPVPHVRHPNAPSTTSRAEGKAGRMGARMMAIVAEGDEDASTCRRLRARGSRRGVARARLATRRRSLPAEASDVRVADVRNRHVSATSSLTANSSASTTFSDLVPRSGASGRADATRLRRCRRLARVDERHATMRDAVATYSRSPLIELADLLSRALPLGARSQPDAREPVRHVKPSP